MKIVDEARRIVSIVALVMGVVLPVTPGSAHTPAGGDVTEAAGFAGTTAGLEARVCTGTLAIVPAAAITTLPPSVQAQNVAVAQSTCGGNLPAGTWYSGEPSFIDIGFWRDGVQIANTRCRADTCSAAFPLGGSLSRTDVLADFHWSLAYGAWNLQEPTRCLFVDGSPLAIRCTAQTTAHI